MIVCDIKIHYLQQTFPVTSQLIFKKNGFKTWDEGQSYILVTLVHSLYCKEKEVHTNKRTISMGENVLPTSMLQGVGTQQLDKENEVRVLFHITLLPKVRNKLVMNAN